MLRYSLAGWVSFPRQSVHFVICPRPFPVNFHLLIHRYYLAIIVKMQTHQAPSCNISSCFIEMSLTGKIFTVINNITAQSCQMVILPISRRCYFKNEAPYMYVCVVYVGNAAWHIIPTVSLIAVHFTGVINDGTHVEAKALCLRTAKPLNLDFMYIYIICTQQFPYWTLNGDKEQLYPFVASPSFLKRYVATYTVKQHPQWAVKRNYSAIKI